MISTWKIFCALVAFMGALGSGRSLQISWSGGVTAGLSTTFTCSSVCFPNCTYSWSLKGRTTDGSMLVWTPDGRDDSVELQCTVRNPQTGISRIRSAFIDVKNPFSVWLSPQTSVPSINQSLSLLCRHASPLDLKVKSERVWYKNGQKVTLHENIGLFQNNESLHFDSLLPSDAGFYQCESFLPASQTRVLSLGFLLSFNLWNVTISGPDEAFPGRLSQFTCLSSCTLNVECTIRWEFRGGFPIGTFFSVHANKLKWTPSNPGTFQNFTCIAENKAAGRSAESTKMVEVKGIPISASEAMKLSRLLLILYFLSAVAF